MGAMKNEILKACYQLVAAAVNGTYQGILITVLVTATLRMLRRTNAATRYAVWFGTLLLLALIIPAHCLRSRWDDGNRPAMVESYVSDAARMVASDLPGDSDTPHEPAGGSSKSQTANPKKTPITKFQKASSPRPSPSVEEREKTREVQGPNAGFSNVGALHEPSNEHAAPAEPGERPRDVGSYRYGAPTQLFSAVDGRKSEYVREQQYLDSAGGAETNSQRSDDPARSFVLAILEAADSNQTDESATPEPGFLLGIKQKLSWLGERMVTPVSWKIVPKVPLLVAALLPMIWLAIAGAKISILIWQLFGIRRLKLNSAAPRPELNALFLSLRENIGARRNVILRISSEHRSPVVLGFFKPVILLPADAGLEASEPILRHELAHVRRRDDWTNLVQHCIKAVFFFHPAIWWVSKRISLEREIACDDQVLHSTRRPKAYALLLADLATRMQPSLLAPGVSTNQSQLKQRIDMILNSNRNTSPRLAKARLGLLATAAAVLAMAAIYSAPRLAFAQSTAAAAPAALALPDAPSAATASAAPAAVVAVSEDAVPSASLAAPAVSAGPKFKRGSEIAVDVRPAIAAQPSIAILTAPAPALPPVASVGVAAPVPVAPMVAMAEPFPEPGQPKTPRPAHRPGKDSSLEDRLDRLEKMVESLVAQQKKNPVHFEFYPKPSSGAMKLDRKDFPEFGKEWQQAQADYAQKMAEFETKRADADKRLAELDKLKAWKDRKGTEKIKELAEKQAKMAVDQAKVAEQAAREAQRGTRDAQRGRSPRKMHDGAHQELEALHKQREMLEKQMEHLDRQIEKLERQFEEQQESDEQDVDVQEEQGDSSNDQHSESSKNNAPAPQPAAK
jgi:beta-lactamase regulating signal transducer with metallopeptidase domain